VRNAKSLIIHVMEKIWDSRYSKGTLWNNNTCTLPKQSQWWLFFETKKKQA